MAVADVTVAAVAVAAVAVAAVAVADVAVTVTATYHPIFIIKLCSFRNKIQMR